MTLYRQISAFCALIAALAACTENVNEGTVWDDPHFIRLTASNQTLSNDENITTVWTLTDKMAVLDRAAEAVCLMTNDTDEGIFYSYDWTGRDPVYAVYPYSKNVTFAEGTIRNMTVPSSQQLISKKCSSGASVGTVAGNRTSYRVNPMRNIMGYVRFALSSSDIRSVKFEAIDGESMAGEIDVDLDALVAGESFWSLSEGKQGVSAITLTPSENSAAEETGCIKAGTYYLALLPQTYTRGIRVTMIPNNELETITKVFAPESGINVDTNTLLDLDSDAIDYLVPETMDIVFDFASGWPFVQEVLSKEGQANDGSRYTGDIYTYCFKYMSGNVEYEENMDFFIRGNKAPYEFVDGSYFVPGSNSARITLPAVRGRRVAAITLVNEQGQVENDKFWLQTISWNEVAVSDTKVNTAYYLTFNTGTKISKLTIKYIKQ